MPRNRALAALVAGLALVGLPGCGAPVLRTYPVTAAPTASGSPTPTAAPTASATPSATHRAIEDVAFRAVVLADPRVPAQLKETIRTCTLGPCLAAPTFTDITGDGVPEAFLSVEGPNAREGDLVYTMRDDEPHLVFAHYGNQAYVEPREGAVVLVQRMYAPEDARCCPSGRDRVSTYRWDGTRLVLASRTGGSPGTSPYDPEDQVVA